MGKIKLSDFSEDEIQELKIQIEEREKNKFLINRPTLNRNNIEKIIECCESHIDISNECGFDKDDLGGYLEDVVKSYLYSNWTEWSDKFNG